MLGHAVHLPADGGDPGDQRPHRPGDRAGHRWQHPRALPEVAASGIVGLLLVANIINLGADLGAMGDALTLLIGGPPHLYVVGFAVGCAALETFSRYERYVVC